MESDTMANPSDFSEGFVVKNPKAMAIWENAYGKENAYCCQNYLSERVRIIHFRAFLWSALK